MKVLVIGSGGREHALVHALAKSPRAEAVFCAPGNAGIAQQATCLDVEVSDHPALIDAIRQHGIEFVVVGPEQPLVDGVVDALTDAGIQTFGPTAAAARLEGSKSFAKEIMAAAGVPTAQGVACATLDSARATIDRFARQNRQVVVKADGLAAGKGVTVADNAEEAHAAVNEIMEELVYGVAGATVVIEERLVGEEASILALVDGETIVTLVPSQDHKPVGEGDTGPNTGGMGAYAPAPVVTGQVMQRIEERILRPTVRTMADRGTPYKGVLYAGLMIVDGDPYVIEFNCRFGDPETQVVLPMLASDLLELLQACCDGTLAQQQAELHEGAATCVVLASGGYPGSYEKGKVINGLQQASAVEGVTVYHAGTRQDNDTIVTSGGRVLGVTARGNSIAASIERAYQAVDLIQFEGAFCRRDIGHRALARQRGKS